MLEEIQKKIIVKTAVELTKTMEINLGPHHIIHFSELLENNLASSYLDLNNLYKLQETKYSNLIKHISKELQEKENKDILTQKFYALRDSKLNSGTMLTELEDYMPDTFFKLEPEIQTKILLNVLDRLNFRNSIVSRKAKQNSGWKYFYLDVLMGEKMDEEFEFGWVLERIFFRIENSYLHHRYIHPLRIKDKYYGAFVFYNNNKKINLTCTEEILISCINEFKLIEDFKELQKDLLVKYSENKGSQIPSQRQTIDDINKIHLQMSLDKFCSFNSKNRKQIINYFEELLNKPVMNWIKTEIDE